jgi:hypothetical protein
VQTAKIDRRSLPLPDRDGSTMREFIAPRSPLERTVAGIWSQALGVSRVGVYDNFFELGGPLATRHACDLATAQGGRCRALASSFFESPTISAMAAQSAKSANVGRDHIAAATRAAQAALQAG